MSPRVPRGVALVARPDAAADAPLLEPVLPCEGPCGTWTVHVRWNTATDPRAGATDLRSMCRCATCQTSRRWGS